PLHLHVHGRVDAIDEIEGARWALHPGFLIDDYCPVSGPLIMIIDISENKVYGDIPRRRTYMADGKIIATHEATRKTVKVEFEENGIAWVILNRPEKRNAMSPALNVDMVDVLEMLE